MGRKANSIDRMRSHCTTDPVTGCWLWRGHLTESGYGLCSYKGKSVKSNRLAWMLVNGPIPDGAHVLHTCDRPACINPEHLYLGDVLLNTHDKILRGRQPRGERSSKAKLTEAIVRDIRLMIASKQVTARAMARKYGVTYQCIDHIVHRRNWAAM